MPLTVDVQQRTADGDVGFRCVTGVRHERAEHGELQNQEVLADFHGRGNSRCGFQGLSASPRHVPADASSCRH